MAKSQRSSIGSITQWRRWTPERARAALEAARESGVSLREFAERHGLALQRLERWRRQLGDGGGTAPGFLEVSPAIDVREARPFEIVLRNGRVLRVDAKFDEEGLRRLLAVVDEAPC
jgi:transposase-like protein